VQGQVLVLKLFRLYHVTAGQLQLPIPWDLKQQEKPKSEEQKVRRVVGQLEEQQPGQVVVQG
jgi:hypothetical protein